MKNKRNNELLLHKISSILIILLFTSVIIISLIWNIIEQNTEIEDYARIKARATITKDIIIRKWAIQREKIYVPVNKKTKPNPYLKVPERDIILRSGKHYTLLNPSFINRQIHEIQKTETGTQGHLTSLNPIRPKNKPDKWEATALKKFMTGVTEVSSVELFNNEPFMRMMKPLITEQSCLRCHAFQGYKKGDIRGGISISIPMKQIKKIVSEHKTSIIGGHISIWILSIISIIIWIKYSYNRIIERKKYTDELLIKNKAISTSSSTMILTDINGTISYANKMFYKMWEINNEEGIEGKSIFSLLRINKSFSENFITELKKMRTWFGELTAIKGDDSEFFVLLSAAISERGDDEKNGITFAFTDITMRKNTELALKKSEEILKERNQTMEKDYKLAQLVQNELLIKKLPELDYLNMHYKYLPLEKVGGDFFKFIQDDNTLGIFIGDVSGHGVASALFHSLINSSIEKISLKHLNSPSRFVKTLNLDLYGHMTSYFITAIYGIFKKNPVTHKIDFIYSNAAHPSPIVIKKDGTIKSYDTSGRIIGIVKEYDFKENTISLSKGDRLFLYTDGIPEASNSNREMIGFEEQLLTLIKKSQQPELDKSLDNIIDNINNFRMETPLSDDLFIIGIEIVDESKSSKKSSDHHVLSYDI